MPPDALQIGWTIAPATMHFLAVASGKSVDRDGVFAVFVGTKNVAFEFFKRRENGVAAIPLTRPALVVWVVRLGHGAGE